MAKILWDDDYLRSFVKELMKPANPIQFWEFDENDEVMEYKDSHFRKLVSSFLPALGVWNLNMGDTEDGNACRYLIFLRDSRSQIINPEALRTILNKVWMFMGSLGDDVKEKFVRTGSKGNPLFTKNFLLNVPELYEKKPLTDTSTSAYRFSRMVGWKSPKKVFQASVHIVRLKMSSSSGTATLLNVITFRRQVGSCWNGNL